MSQKHISREPTVVDEEMLQNAVKEQYPRDEDENLPIEEAMEYEQVPQLRLDYRNILKIDHLWQFKALTKLHLDNNMIEKIEGLESLTNLVWLDLSFNRIEVIEGLDTLVNLEDLSLFNNKISVIQNLDSLLKLNLLSIGNNRLNQLDNIVYLRKFKKLQTLNLRGNPLCDSDIYKVFIAAYVPQLVYLDFRLLDQETRIEARVKYALEIQHFIEKEEEEEHELEEKRKEDEELGHHMDAFVEYLNGAQLFNSMYVDDPDTVKLAFLPNLSEMLESYQNQLVSLCMELFATGLIQQEKRKVEVSSFFDSAQKAVETNRKMAAEIISEFEQSRKKGPELNSDALKKVTESIEQLNDDLFTLEFQLVDQLEDIRKEFDRNLSDMVGGFIETVNGIFAQCRDLEKRHNEKVVEIALSFQERVAKHEMLDDIPDDVLLLFIDRDSALNAVSASHDSHMLKIDNREDQLVTRINSWMTNLVTSIQKEEVSRNSKRIKEIHHYINYLLNQLC